MRLASPDVRVTVSGTSAETVRCGLDPEGGAHLMRLLSDLYSDSAAAVLREYSVNALDSHIAAGNTGPVEVTLPSDLNPVLVVADHGTGLSRDDMIRVYSRYGASTKRDSNNQTGAFGLGSKSAFTLGQQFTVTAVKDGERTAAAFGIGPDGAGTVTILDHRECGERNGVTVTIAVNDAAALRRAAGPVFAGWQPGTVLVDGQQPESVLDDPVNLGEGLFLADCPEGADAAWGGAGLIVIMGGVCYPVTRGLRDALSRRLPSQTPHSLLHGSFRRRVFAVIPIGDADIAPSREELRDTPRTLGRLERAVAAYMDGIETVARREIDAAPTMTAAVVHAHLRVRRDHHLGDARAAGDDWAWRGKRPTGKVDVPYAMSEYASSLYGARSRRGGKCEHKRDGFSAHRGETWPVSSSSPGWRRRGGRPRCGQSACSWKATASTRGWCSPRLARSPWNGSRGAGRACSLQCRWGSTWRW